MVLRGLGCAIGWSRASRGCEKPAGVAQKSPRGTDTIGSTARSRRSIDRD